MTSTNPETIEKTETQEIPDKTLKLTNGDTLYFVKELRGREYRLLKSRMASTITMDIRAVDVQNPSEIKKEINMGSYMDIIAKAIDIFVAKIVSEQGAEIVPSLAYFDSLSMQDADTVFSELENLISNNKLGELKKN